MNLASTDYVTLPLPLFLLCLGAAAGLAGLLVATAAERLTRVRQEQAHGERHRHGADYQHNPGCATCSPRAATPTGTDR